MADELKSNKIPATLQSRDEGERKPKPSQADGKTVEKTLEGKDKKKKRHRDTLAIGELIPNKTSNITWKIQSVLGAGGFGDVYKVVMENDPKTEYALKTEQATGERSMLRLKVEAEAMISCNKHKHRGHFVEIIDRGKNEKFKFIVMTLVGSNLDSYRKKTDADFSISTSMQIAIQSMEALRDFHQAGWLHRDIKPHNFAYGIGDKMSVIYILDFGIARRIHDKNKKVRVQRIYVKFLGTMRYASRRCHKCLEQGRKDDVETWIYMMFDVFHRNKGLPWRKELDKNAVISQKELFWKKEYKETFHTYYESHCPILKEFYLIIDCVRELEYEDEPPYNQIIDHLKVTSKQKKINLRLPLDWMAKKEVAEAGMTMAGAPTQACGPAQTCVPTQVVPKDACGPTQVDDASKMISKIELEKKQ